MALDEAFWRGRRVFVTGHTGFKGSWLCLWLQQLGAHTVGYSLGVPTSPNLFELAGLSGGMQSLTGDIRDRNGLRTAIRCSEPDVVMHLAAQSTVLRGYESPTETYDTNVSGTLNVLDAVRESATVHSALIVTTDKCYRQNGGRRRPFRETDPLGGQDPYSSSKACAELVVDAYRSSYFDKDRPAVSVATARAGNVIGGGDWTPYRIVPDMVRAFESGRAAEIRNPTHIRPWQHVLDAISGYLMLVERLGTSAKDYAEAWNFGPSADDRVSVAHLADRLVSLWGDGATWQRLDSTYPVESPELRLDSSKARKRLGWQPQLDTETALRWTVEWHKAVAGGSSARESSVKQIEAYVNRLARSSQ